MRKDAYRKEIVSNYIDRYKSHGTKTMARACYKDNPQVWPTFQACYNSFRYFCGARGRQNRKYALIIRNKKTRDRCQRWGSLIPQPQPSDFKIAQLPPNVKRWLVIADLHVPYHDHRALTICLEHADGKCDGVLINGDGLDCYSMSDFLTDPRERDFQKEIESWCMMLDALKKLRGIKSIVWRAANHEFRLERYLMRKAPELFGLDVVTWGSLCDLERRGVILVPYHHIIQHFDLTILHGDEYGNAFFAPANQARSDFLKALSCTLTAHGHKTSHHNAMTATGKAISCWSVGCLCDLHPSWRRMTGWNHGWAYLDTGKNWLVTNHRLVEGRVF